ncbi:30S ribosomal protein S7 [Parcubacteria bacterium SG8_24]|nr:MAG: 30S ribosomal protein S7 [Parcubacteria bacterium SG8_24]
MRGKRAIRRTVASDPKYGNEVVGRFINYVMRDGKKTVAQRVVYGALDIMAEKTKADPVEVFDRAIRNVQPAVEVRSKRVGGANYQIPIQVRGERKLALAFRWLIAAAKSRKGRPMADKLATELLAAANNEGDAVKKKLDVQRMAEANRAFAHFGRSRRK